MRLAALLVAALLPLAAQAEDQHPGNLAPGPYFGSLRCGDGSLTIEAFVLPPGTIPEVLVVIDGRLDRPTRSPMMFEAENLSSIWGESLVVRRWLYGPELANVAFYYGGIDQPPSSVAGTVSSTVNGAVVGMPGCDRTGLNLADHENSPWVFERYNEIMADPAGYERRAVMRWKAFDLHGVYLESQWDDFWDQVDAISSPPLRTARPAPPAARSTAPTREKPT